MAKKIVSAIMFPATSEAQNNTAVLVKTTPIEVVDFLDNINFWFAIWLETVLPKISVTLWRPENVLNFNRICDIFGHIFQNPFLFKASSILNLWDSVEDPSYLDGRYL